MRRAFGRAMRAALIAGLLLELLSLGMLPAALAADAAGPGAQATDPCRGPLPALVQEYVDPSAGFRLSYPDGWVWRSRSDALPGTRSDVVWFGPRPGLGEPGCVLTVRTAMHYFLRDTSLDEMRTATAMLDLASLLSRRLQGQAAQAAQPPVPGAVPSQTLSPFWRDGRRGFWGMEPGTLPGGQPYYREIGTGPVQDFQRRERNGNVERYVIAVSPRAMLEIVAEMTTPEYERGYGRLVRQVVDSVRTGEATSSHPGPFAYTLGAANDACQVVITAYELGQPAAGRPRSLLLDRAAVVQRLEIEGVAFVWNEADCGQAIDQVGLFLEPPVDEGVLPVQTVAVYNLPSPPPPVPSERYQVPEPPAQAGYFLSWGIPPDLYGQRELYIAARLSSGPWSWITRRVNIAPPLSVEIDANPPEVEIGDLVTVVMRVFNNTSSTVQGVRPILFEAQGSGGVLLQSGPTVSQSQPDGCALTTSPTVQRAAPAPGPAGATAGQAQPSAQTTAPGQQPATITLAPLGSDRPNCVLFQWTFRALRRGAVSFTGTAEGRLAAAPAARLLARQETTPAVLLPPASPWQMEGGTTVTAPVSTATDLRVNVRPPAIASQPAVSALPVPDNPRAVVLLVAVRNENATASLYNVRADYRLVLGAPEGRPVATREYSYVLGVDAFGQPQPVRPLGYLLASDDQCREPRRLFGVYLLSERARSRLVALSQASATLGPLQLLPGDTVPELFAGTCVVFARTVELAEQLDPEQLLFARGQVSCRIRFDDTAAGDREACPTQPIVGGPFTLTDVQELAGSATGPLPPSGVGAPRATAPGGAPAGPYGAPPVSATGAGGALAPALGTGRGEISVSQRTLQQALALEASGAGQPGGQQPPGGPAPAGGAAPEGPQAGVAAAPPTPVASAPTVAGQELARAAEIVGPITECPPQPGPLVVCLRAYPVRSRDARAFDIGDVVRLELQVFNFSDGAITNVQPAPVVANGTTVGAGALGFGRDPVSTAASEAAAIAAANAASRGASTEQAAAAAAAAAEGLRAAAAGITGAPSEDQCRVEAGGLVPGGVANQIRQLSGPNPLVVSRVPRNGSATFTWDFLVQELRGGPQLVFQTYATAQSPDGPLSSVAVQSDPLEKRVLCVLATLDARPTQVRSGEVVTVTMRGENSTYFLRGTQQFTPGRYYFDVFPAQLRPVIEQGSLLQVDLLSGPNNPILGIANGVSLGPGEQTTFTWQFRVEGSGCFRLRGQLTARQQRSSAPFFTNTAETPRICVEGPVPRALLER